MIETVIGWSVFGVVAAPAVLVIARELLAEAGFWWWMRRHDELRPAAAALPGPAALGAVFAGLVVDGEIVERA